MTEPILLKRIDDDDPDRDTWCSPPLLTDAIGEVDIDPCSNERSTVRARRTFRLDRGQDGLALARFVSRSSLVFINCPYSRGQVEKWVRAYRHTRFIFLLRFDTSTGWFSELIERTTIVAALREKRTNFVPPPGIEGGSNVFPHALFYARQDDVSAQIRELCYLWSPCR